MAIDQIDKLWAALGNSQDQKLFFQSATNVAGGWVNLNQAVTGGFGIMATPTAYGSGGTTYNQSSFTTGFPRWTANGATSTYIGRGAITLATAGSVHLYDMLWACSGFSSIVTTAQSVVSFSGMPSRSGTTGHEIWIGCSSATGATASSITVQYTNQSGTSGRNTVSTAAIASWPGNRMTQVPLQSGDTGVQSIQSFTFSASTGTAGNVWLMVLDRIASIGSPVANVTVGADFAAMGFPKIDDQSCLTFISQGTTTSTGIMMGQLSIVQG